MRIPLALALAVLTAVAARLPHSLPDDTYAFPKFRVVFLNGQPVLNHTAQKWLTDGLPGGELEFLDQPWSDPASSPVGIDGGDGHAPPHPSYSLEHMKMGPKDSYVCLIPSPLEHVPPVVEEDDDTNLSPARSWSLLQPLSGACLYHRQGWFTYSYCHNDEIRQFKELIPTTPRTPGAYTPEEDPEWESYTLGRAPVAREPGADLTVAEQNAQAANLELARTAGSRYLVQRWGDGTICDKTGKPREIEVQFHCSMTMTDNILFVKEAKTCSYVLVINTPRLCGEPGFRSRHDVREEALIRCREVVHTITEQQADLPTSDQPLKIPRRKPILPPAQPVAAKGDTENDSATKDKLFNQLFKKTLAALMASKDGSIPGGKVVHIDDEEEVVIELIDDPLLDEEHVESAERLVESLRAAGYDVTAQFVGGKQKSVKSNDEKKTDKQEDKSRKLMDQFNEGRDEL